MSNKKSELSKKEVEKNLKKVVDPELGVNIIDLGLVYGIEINRDKVEVKMTLTFPGCPLKYRIIGDVKQAIESVPGVKSVNIELVWDPPWSPSRVKKEIREKLGI